MHCTGLHCSRRLHDPDYRRRSLEQGRRNRPRGPPHQLQGMAVLEAPLHAQARLHAGVRRVGVRRVRQPGRVPRRSQRDVQRIRRLQRRPDAHALHAGGRRRLRHYHDRNQDRRGPIPDSDPNPKRRQLRYFFHLQVSESNMLPHLDLMIPALNDATSVYNATLDGKRIKCSAGNLFKLKFGGLNLALCASGAEGVHVYGSDMEITVKYLDAPVKITAPKLSAKAKSECEKVVNATAVTSTSAALLTGEPIPESESRSLDFGSDVDLVSATCKCRTTPRPCLFIHGLGIDYAKEELQDSFDYYWGNLSDHAPCCTAFKYMIWNSMETGWNNETQQQTLCNLATSLVETGPPTEITDTIIVTHSMGGLMLASAIANGKCSLGNSSSWIATSPPMTGSMGSDFAQESCAGEHTVLMEALGNVTGQCPVLGATLSLAYEDEEHSSTELNTQYEAAQEVYHTRVHAVMCSNGYSGLFSVYQAMYCLLGAGLPHKSGKNDGMVEFQSCAGGFPLEQFGDHYLDQFYVTKLNHADTTFYNGDGLFSSAKKPVKWFECVL